MAKGGRWKRDGQKERESEVRSRASYLQGPCIHGSALLTTQRPMEGERELRGTWFRQERSSVVVVGPRVERCRVTDLSRRDRVSFSFVAFTWIKFDTVCCSFRSHTAAYVRVTESQWQGNEHASTNVSPLRRKHDKQKIERKRRESWLGADWVVSRNFKRCNQPSKTRVVRSVRCRARRSLCDQPMSTDCYQESMKFAEVCLFSNF